MNSVSSATRREARARSQNAASSAMSFMYKLGSFRKPMFNVQVWCPAAVTSNRAKMPATRTRRAASSVEPGDDKRADTDPQQPESRTGRRRPVRVPPPPVARPVSYTHLRAHETRHDLVCRLLLE